uniref:SSD domain-containing protein n=1 Tax=Steinernema glaseri TaxID=37863 RepID=A0A1I7YD67_9BILA
MSSFQNGFQVKMAERGLNSSRSERISLKYPVTKLFGREVSLQPNFFGIQLAEGPAAERLSNMESVRLIILQFRAEQHDAWSDDDVKKWELAVNDFFAQHYLSERLRVLVLSTSSVQKEILRAGMSLSPFLLVGFFVMSVFSVATTLASATFMHQLSWHKVTLAVMACVVPFMSCGAAFGLLFFCGMRFGPILCVTPFLILAIGVDDSFLMLHAWHRVVKKARQERRPDDSLENRLAEVLVESGPSITISAATNILAFTVGALTSPPEIQLFCYANAMAIFVDTVFSETIYAAMMALAGRVEMRKEKLQEKEDVEGETRWEHRLKEKTARFLDVYLGQLTKTWVSIAVVVLYCGYVAISVWGITLLRTDLDTRKFFLKDSVLIEVDHLRTELVVPYFTPLTVFVNRPGNLSDPERRARLDALVTHFETSKDAIGPDSTNNPFGEESSSDFDADELPEFLKWPEYSFWKGFLKLKEADGGSVELERFFFTTGFSGHKLQDWAERGALLARWRADVDGFREEFDASIFSDDALFLDLIEVIPSVTWQSVAATLLCMAVVCFLFMGDLFTVLVASLSISSICLGVFGLLCFWGINLDPIMMSAGVMAIGFSVDIPAHIAFHFYRTRGDGASVPLRLQHTLAAVGFPVVQAGVSTILCVLSLLCVSLYMSEVFVKTMFLCISLGLLHGFILIPVVFSLAHRLTPKRRQQKSFRTTVAVGEEPKKC